MSADPATLSALRQRIARIERGGTPATATRGHPAGTADGGARLTFGLAALDEHLPGGGLAAAAVHEIVDGDGGPIPGGAATGFAAALAGRRQRADGDAPARPVVWIAPRHGLHESLYRHGLAAFGLDPAALLVVRIPGQGRTGATQTLWALEECLRERAVGLVCAELDALDLAASRRLQLAAAGGGTTGLLLRSGAAAATALPPTASVTRWRVAAAPSLAIGVPRWRVELLRARNGRPHHWLLEWHHDPDFAAPVSAAPRAGDRPPAGFALAAALCDRPDRPARQRAPAAPGRGRQRAA